MAISYGFFNSVNGDRKYNADDISNYFLKLISNGVFATPSNAMQVQANTGMSVQVSAGWGFINCKWINNSAPYVLNVDAADIALNRIDRVVLRLNAANNARTMSIAVKKGIAAANPTPPTLTRVSGGVWELSLAQIYVAANATAISQANITDERANTSVCGWVTGLIQQIDTTNLFAQYNAAFYEWFNEVKQTLSSAIILKQFRSIYTTITANEYVIPINIPQYLPELDMINVFVNGMRLNQLEYTVSGQNVTLTTPLDIVGTVVEIQVVKSVDGTGAESVVDDVLEMKTQLGGLSFVKCTQSEYDAITTPDENTVYIIVG